MRRWKVLESHTIFKNAWFDIKEEKVQFSDELALEGVVAMVFGDWVNVVPLTREKEVVLVKQYRHGIADFTVETPSGSIEEQETPQKSGERELLEETGFKVGRLVYLGKSLTNPGLMNNFMHHVLALDCEAYQEAQVGFDGEEIEHWLEPFETVLQKARQGEIHHGFTVEGLLRAKDWLDRNPG